MDYMRSNCANDLIENGTHGTNRSGYLDLVQDPDQHQTAQYGEPRALLSIRNQHIFSRQQICAARPPIVETVESMTIGKTRPN
jgi:hypothetical protein